MQETVSDEARGDQWGVHSIDKVPAYLKEPKVGVASIGREAVNLSSPHQL